MSGIRDESGIRDVKSVMSPESGMSGIRDVWNQ